MPIAYPISLQRLIGYFSKLPGVGKRSAERLALAALKWPENELAGFADALGTIREHIHPCRVCGNLAEEELCPICQDATRTKSIVCVVEQPTQIIVLENAGCFRGLYHVLGGKLSPLSGVGPDNLRFRELRERVAAGGISELIVATSPDVEGEATAHYLADEFSSQDISITRIAAGVPVGSDLTYADAATLAIAINARRSMQ